MTVSNVGFTYYNINSSYKLDTSFSPVQTSHPGSSTSTDICVWIGWRKLPKVHGMEWPHLRESGSRESGGTTIQYEGNSEKYRLSPCFFPKIYLLKLRIFHLFVSPHKEKLHPKQNHPQKLWVVSTRYFHPTSPWTTFPESLSGIPLRTLLSL